MAQEARARGARVAILAATGDAGLARARTALTATARRARPVGPAEGRPLCCGAPAHVRAAVRALGVRDRSGVAVRAHRRAPAASAHAGAVHADIVPRAIEVGRAGRPGLAVAGASRSADELRATRPARQGLAAAVRHRAAGAPGGRAGRRHAPATAAAAPGAGGEGEDRERGGQEPSEHDASLRELRAHDDSIRERAAEPRLGPLRLVRVYGGGLLHGLDCGGPLQSELVDGLLAHLRPQRRLHLLRRRFNRRCTGTAPRRRGLLRRRPVPELAARGRSHSFPAMEFVMADPEARDVEKVASRAQFVAKLRRLADVLKPSSRSRSRSRTSGSPSRPMPR